MHESAAKTNKKYPDKSRTKQRSVMTTIQHVQEEAVDDITENITHQ